MKTRRLPWATAKGCDNRILLPVGRPASFPAEGLFNRGDIDPCRTCVTGEQAEWLTHA